MEIGERIKNKRESLGMTQEELAIKAGYKSRSSINKIEKDGRGLPQSKILLIAKALDTTPAYLMGWDEEKIVFRCDMSNAKKHYENQKRLLKYFDSLNFIGEEEAVKRVEELTHLPKYTENQKPLLKEIPNSIKTVPIKGRPKAAHERTDIEVTDEMRKHDDDIMNDNSEWE